MKKSQLDANTYGVGELITQRKLFEVPEHQRDYSWGSGEIEQLLNDFRHAFECDAADYFIGLVVLQGPVDGVWQILDGQQRLATTTMIYAALREWLISRDFQTDADQIESEFIAVRQLGGTSTSRLKLNTENRLIFDDYVIRNRPTAEIIALAKGYPRSSSNRGLLDGTLKIRDWIASFARSDNEAPDAQARKLFAFSTFIETKVKVVCVDVSSEADAYVLFESLNDRGADLSALDLVKNYIFSFTYSKNADSIRRNWASMSQFIEGRDADDFLKVFWTSRFGLIQKTDLYRRIRSAYQGEAGAASLCSELAKAAIILDQLEDRKNPVWSEYPELTRDYLHQLSIIGSRQLRPVLVSAVSKFSAYEFTSLLWSLIVLLVRYQLVGRERTGGLEKVLGPLAADIWSGKIASTQDAERSLMTILPNDSDFAHSFENLVETKAARVTYLLAGVEQWIESAGMAAPNIGAITERVEVLSQITHPGKTTDQLDVPVEFFGVGNFILIERNLAAVFESGPWAQRAMSLQRSAFATTRAIAEATDYPGVNEIAQRARYLSNHATSAWSFNRRRS